MQPDARIDEFRAISERWCRTRVQNMFDQDRHYFTFPEPDNTRAIIDAGVAQAFDRLFDPAQYPEGMTRTAVIDRAKQDFKSWLEEYYDHFDDAEFRLTGRRRGNKGNPGDVALTVYSALPNLLVGALRELDRRDTNEARESEGAPDATIQKSGLMHDRPRGAGRKLGD